MHRAGYKLKINAAQAYQKNAWQQFFKAVIQKQYPIEQELKHDGTTTVTRVAFQGEHYVVKRYNTKNKWHFIRRFVQQSRAKNCFTMAQEYNLAGIHTPEPLAYIQETILGLKLRSWYICRYEEGILLSEALEGQQVVPNELLILIERLFNRLKDYSLTHGDMKATNLIVLDQQLCIIDLDAAKHHHSERTWVKANQKDWNRLILNWPSQSSVNQTFLALKERLAPPSAN